MITLSAIPATDRPAWRRVAQACVLIAAAFCLFVTLMLGWLWMQDKMHHPLVETATGQIASLREQIQSHPADDSLKTRLRQADTAVREAYWTRRIQMRRGAWLLLAGAAVLAAGIKAMRALEIRPLLREQLLAPDRGEAETRWALWTVSGVGGAITLLLLAAAHWSVDHTFIAVEETAAPVAETSVTAQQLLDQWPAFRGWGGAAGRPLDPPVRTWDGASGKNILWHSPVPLPGNSSPIIWNNTVVLTGATDSERKIMAFSLASGKLLWQTAIGGAGPAPEISDETSFAAPTPVTDGRRAYAIFATGDIGAVDLATGEKLWQSTLGKPASAYGYAASLALYPDPAGTRIIVQWDMGAVEDNQSRLVAIDGRTGKTLWRTSRPVGNSWASPLVTKVEGDPIAWQVITAANPWIIGYDAATGAELWRCSALGGDVAPSPTTAAHDGKTYVFAAEEGAHRAAIPISNTRGTISPAWKFADEGLPDIVSPVSDGKYVWTVIDAGKLFCFDAGTGKKVWDHDFGAGFRATPVIIGTGTKRELWLTEAGGITHRLFIGDQFNEIGSCALGEEVAASFAFSGSGSLARLVIRGKDNLYCIGAPATAAAEAP